MNMHSSIHPSPHRQRGAVLVVSLILLVILTLLGMSVMNTSQLEERMAANVQEVNQSFHSAETGLSWGIANEIADLNPDVDVPATTATIPSGVGRTDELEYSLQFIADANPGGLWDVAQFRAAHFDMLSIGTSGSGLETTLHGGLKKIARR